MKSFLITLIFFSLLTEENISAQNSYYFSDSLAQWNVLETELTEHTINSTQIFNANGNALIGNFQYQLILGSAGNQYIRQDTTGKVFYWAAGDTIDHLIYDFGKVKGDTFSFSNPWIYNPLANAPIFATVDSTDTVYWDKPRKRMFTCLHFGVFETSCQNPILICVEGVGALNSQFLFPGIDQVTTGQPAYNLLCYFNDGNQVYHDTSYQSCALNSSGNGITTMEQQIVAHILPNPVTENYFDVQFNSTAPPTTHLQLFDVTGRMIMLEPLMGKSTRINLDNVSKGMYLYTISSPDQIIEAGRLVIQ